MPSPRLRAVALLALAATAGCSNAGENSAFGITKTGKVDVLVYLDRDGSRTPTQPDTVFRGARVGLLTGTVDDTAAIRTTDAQGIASFLPVPLGTYQVTVDPKSIGDTIRVQQIDSATARVTATDTARASLVRLGYREVSTATLRTLPPGLRVLVRGVVLAGVQSFRDTTSHLSDSTGSLRLTRALNAIGGAGNNPGDSIAAIGTTATRDGQPVLDLARIVTFQRGGVAPVPLAVSTLTAAGAQGGRLDAGLVQVTGATIIDTATVAPDFRVNISDGTGIVELRLDGTQSYNRTAFRPGRTLDARGVLVPDGAGRWRLKPRSVNDVVLF